MISKIKEMIKKYKNYIISVIIALLVGAISAFLTRKNMGVFDEVKKPALTPPGFAFPIVWTILFVLMGISAAIIYERKNTMEEDVSNALTTYALSLGFNFFWSILFFNMRYFMFAFVWLIGLLITIILTIIKYYKIDKKAAYLQIPYFIWVLFAGYLNLMIAIMQ